MDNAEFKDMVLSAIDKLEQQGVPSKDAFRGCYYLNKENNHCCIVGHMMPDDKTRELADSYGNGDVGSLVQEGFQWFEKFTHKQTELLWNLQGIHDAVNVDAPVTEACKEMRKLVEKFN